MAKWEKSLVTIDTCNIITPAGKYIKNVMPDLIRHPVPCWIPAVVYPPQAGGNDDKRTFIITIQ
jgi:hypothetical protein